MSVGDSGFDEVGAGLLGAVAVLRWARPDLLADVAEHVAETDGGDDRAWVRAAGWVLHGRAAVGDGRVCAATILDDLGSRARGLFDDPAADRLRVEIALLAATAGETGTARELVAPVLAGSMSAETRADAFGVIVRCVAEERPDAVGDPARRAEVAWAEVGGPQAEIGAAAVALLAASAHRRSSHPAAAAERAAEGLTRLDQVRGHRPATPSRHLAAALAAEWIGALLDAGRPADAREGCVPLEARLRESARPSRQIALLRLTVVRAMVGSSPLTELADALEQTVRDATVIDVPELEALCLSTLAALHEQAGRAVAAGDARRRAAEARSLDSARRDQFLAALRGVSRSAVEAPSALWVPTNGSSPIGDLVARAFAETPRAEPVADQVDRPEQPAGDPWSTGRWAATPPGGTNGHGTRREAAPSVDPLDTTDDGWLQAAMAELDRVWGSPLMQPSEPVTLPEVAPPATGCTVVVDVVRAGDPVTGAGAVATVRQVAEHVAEALPGGARLRRDEHTITVVLPGWDRADAGDWMHRTLPARFAALVSEFHPTGTALRATVHDVDGPVGAQLLQRLDAAPDRRGGGRQDGGAADGAGMLGRNGGVGRRRRADRPDEQSHGDGPTGATGRLAAGSPSAHDRHPNGADPSTRHGRGSRPAVTPAGRDVDALLRELRDGRSRDVQASGAHRARAVAEPPWSASGWNGERSAAGARGRQPDRSDPLGGTSRGRPAPPEPPGPGAYPSVDRDRNGQPQLASPPRGGPPEPVPDARSTSVDGGSRGDRPGSSSGRRRSDPLEGAARPGSPDDDVREWRDRAATETEGLGLADLLAGALAAYRSI